MIAKLRPAPNVSLVGAHWMILLTLILIFSLITEVESARIRIPVPVQEQEPDPWYIQLIKVLIGLLVLTGIYALIWRIRNDGDIQAEKRIAERIESRRNRKAR